MELFREYLQDMKENRRTPYEFWVVFEDYTKVYIEDVHKFCLDTLRKEIIGVAIHVPGECWISWFENPFGTTLEGRYYVAELAIDNIGSIHQYLSAARDRQIIHVKEVVLSDVRNYAIANPL